MVTTYQVPLGDRIDVWDFDAETPGGVRVAEVTAREAAAAPDLADALEAIIPYVGKDPHGLIGKAHVALRKAGRLE